MTAHESKGAKQAGPHSDGGLLAGTPLARPPSELRPWVNGSLQESCYRLPGPLLTRLQPQGRQDSSHLENRCPKHRGRNGLLSAEDTETLAEMTWAGGSWSPRPGRLFEKQGSLRWERKSPFADISLTCRCPHSFQGPASAFIPPESRFWGNGSFLS